VDSVSSEAPSHSRGGAAETMGGQRKCGLRDKPWDDQRDAQRMRQCLYRTRDGIGIADLHKLNAYEGLSVREAIAADSGEYP